MEKFEVHLMQERIAELSRQLAAHSASAARSMEGSTSDGLVDIASLEGRIQPGPRT
jgi:hypothetical protein